MRVLRINRELDVDEIDAEPDDWLPSEEADDWDAVTIANGTHDAYVDDNGIFRPGAIMASVDGNRLPLPAYVVRIDGENVSDATLSIDELKAMIR